MRVLIVAPNISRRMGGEAVLPYHYMRELRALGHEVRALTHARVRDELRESDVWEDGAFAFVEDAPAERALHGLGRLAPAAFGDALANTLIGAVTLSRLAGRARRLAREWAVDVVHQPTPVSPRMPSFLTGLDAPVVIGPLNGGMTFPPAFRADYSRGAEAVAAVGRGVAGFGNAVFAGKRRAARVIVANRRTRAALPAGLADDRIETLVDNGVDLAAWSPPPAVRAQPPRFVFVGRLIRLKAVDLLIEAFAALDREARLVVIGDGPERARLERLAGAACAPRAVEFHGFRPQTEIRDVLAAATALVLPSMRDCGGAVILEAFACRTPAIATDWGGPQDYVTEETGYLIAPTSRKTFVEGLTAAMRRLCDDPASGERMGAAARARVEAAFTWRAKAEAMVEIYKRAIANAQA